MWCLISMELSESVFFIFSSRPVPGLSKYPPTPQVQLTGGGAGRKFPCFGVTIPAQPHVSLLPDARSVFLRHRDSQRFSRSSIDSTVFVHQLSSLSLQKQLRHYRVSSVFP